VNLEDGGKKNPEVEKLLEAEEGARDFSNQEGVIECPLKKKAKETKPPVRALFWSIREFGGGFQTPAQRPDYCIQAYAALIRAVKADVVLLTGLTRTIGWLPELQGKVMRMREQTLDSGLEEARRLLAALGGGWRLAPANGPDGKPAYHLHESACFLYDTARGIECGDVEIAACGPAFLAIAPMQIPGTFDAPPKLPLLAPLSTGRYTFSREVPPDPAAGASLPPSGLVGFTAGNELSGSSEYLDFRTECDVEYSRPLNDGTVLKIPYWEEVASNEECLIENHIAVNAADVVLQDTAMHWEALRPDQHPKQLDKVYGRLADSLLVRNTGGAAPRLEKLRVMDLVRAALDEEALGAAATGPALEEDSAIVAQRSAFAETLARTRDASPATKIERQIAEAALFARTLSDHWPVVADVRLA
jgi:hypothetical protein